MMNDIVQGKVAWARLKNGSKSCRDWVLVGHALHLREWDASAIFTARSEGK
jgi:hypothetical protein